MKNLVYYKNILENVQKIKQEVMINLADEIPFGITDKAALKELDILADISGLVIGQLHRQGLPLLDVEGKEELKKIEIDGEFYTCHMSKLKEASAKIPEEKKEVSETTNKTDAVEETTSVTVPGPEEIKEENEEDFNIEEMDVEDIVEEDATDDIPSSSAQIIGEYTDAPVVSSLSSSEFFIEENAKRYKDFVYDTRRVMVSHIGSAAEEITFTIAPLKMGKSAVSVPIIVNAYYRGKNYTASSYDKEEDGRNTVIIEVNEYYFLCRGYISENGEFGSRITTTGISANQSDKLVVVSEELHRPTGASVGNGHIKIRYNGEDGPGILEVFPLDIEKQEYLVMTRCGEFTEYGIVNQSGRGLSRFLLIDNDVNSELICTWGEDELISEIMPV